MPARKRQEFTPFAQLLERWMKSHPGFMSFSDFAEIVELSPQIISEVFTKGKVLSQASMQKIADNTRAYDETYFPDEDLCGIPLEDMLAVRTASKPDLMAYLNGYVASHGDLKPAERQHMMEILREAEQAYLAGTPIAENIAKAYPKAANG